MSSNAAHGGQKTVYADLLKPDRVANGFHAERLPDLANDEVGVHSTSGASVDVFLEMPTLQMTASRVTTCTTEIFFVYLLLVFHSLFVLLSILCILPGDGVWLNTSFF